MTDSFQNYSEESIVESSTVFYRATLRLILSVCFSFLALSHQALSSDDVKEVRKRIVSHCQIPGYRYGNLNLYWRLAKHRKRPTLLYMHGSGGMWKITDKGRKIRTVTKYFLNAARRNDWNVVLMDVFTGRGVRKWNEWGSFYAHDFHETYRWVAKMAPQHPEIDLNRVVIAGTSMGAIATLFAIHRKTCPSDVKFAGAVGLSALCSPFVGGGDSREGVVVPDYQPTSPLLILHGELDDLCATYHCKRLYEKLKGGPTEIEAHFYPGMGHDLLARVPLTRYYSDSHSWNRGVDLSSEEARNRLTESRKVFRDFVNRVTVKVTERGR